MVGHHVVQFAGDPGALLGRGPGRPIVALGFRLGRTVLHLLDVPAPARLSTAAYHAARLTKADTVASYGWLWPGESWEMVEPITVRMMVTRRTRGGQRSMT